MDALGMAKTLHPLEVKILLTYEPLTQIDADKVRSDLGFREGQEQQAFSWLMSKGLLEEVARTPVTCYELTPLGREFVQKGTPEERIFSLLSAQGPKTFAEMMQALGLDQRILDRPLVFSPRKVWLPWIRNGVPFSKKAQSCLQESLP